MAADLDRFKLKPSDVAFAFTESDAGRLDGGDWGKAVIGQPRALEALLLGVGIHAKGYNVFVTGAPGTGRRTAVKKVLSEYRPAGLALHDIAYVFNFKSPLEPRVLSFKAGAARAFRKDVHTLIENVKKIVRLQLSSAEFKARKDAIVSGFEKEENSRIAAFERELLSNGFHIVQIEGEEGSAATDIVPVVDGGNSDFDALQKLVAEGKMAEADWNALRERYYEYMDRMKVLFAELRRGRVELEVKLETLRNDTLKPLIQSEIALLKTRHPDERILRWFHDLEKDLFQHLYLFQPPTDESGVKTPRTPPLSRYGVNVFVDNGDLERIPIVFEAHPSFVNLFGSIETHPEIPGESRIAYLKVRAGSIHRASGGFLVMRAEDLIQEEESWSCLKRVLQTGRAEIFPPSGPYGTPTAPVKPEPAEVDVKVVLMGGESSYDVLYGADPDFQKLFKVSAEFDSSMPRNDETTREYVAFIHKIVREEGLRDITRDGIAAVVEHGVRLSEYRDRLSTRFSLIADLLREADYHAGRSGKPSIDAESVTGAERRRAYLASLPEEKLGDMILSGEIILKVSGTAIGRVNGLAVHDRGYYAFGLPAVISAQVSPGENGVINIEGESGLSGEIYDKAVLIVEGFLRSRYARNFPLMVSASVCFEQSYTAVEGDSASSTAVYALLSAIAGVPLRQDIAVTGSMNQMGQIQPVGGVTEKIEGFYRICERAGFSGTQGVMIPRQNVVNLTLSREVQAAVTEGRFMLYAVSSIDEGIEVLTGLSAGTADAKGEFPPDSFNGRVRSELLAMTKTIKTYLS
ncbi:MAG: ATP-binding protein [Spirochaetes bacterium]|nr:ATP-binding protein [Spirochaetota bacterium]